MRLPTHDASAVSGSCRSKISDRLYGQRISSSMAVYRILSALSYTVYIWDVGRRLEAAISWPGIMQTSRLRRFLAEKQRTFNFPASTGYTALIVSLALP